ncbi:hypothetical protein M3Y99_00933400 [Aphelenchoides fujianensis]|nr:hypothetical protein M3Y99_00933400 [Aphelenchoides fujianensis]
MGSADNEARHTKLNEVRLLFVLLVRVIFPRVQSDAIAPRSPTTSPVTNETAAIRPPGQQTPVVSNRTSSPLVRAFKEGIALGNRTGHELGEIVGFGRGVAVGEVVGKSEAEREFALTEWKTAHLRGIFIGGISFTFLACCLACCCPCFCAAVDPNWNGPYVHVYESSSREPLEAAGKLISVFPPRRCVTHAHGADAPQMTKLRLLTVLFVCAILPYAAQAAIRPTVPSPGANRADVVANTTALPPSEGVLLRTFREGYEQGRADGAERGFDQGYKQGHEQGNKTGHEAGWSKGYDLGYGLGKSSGYSGGQLDAYFSVLVFVFVVVVVVFLVWAVRECCGKEIGRACFKGSRS